MTDTICHSHREVSQKKRLSTSMIKSRQAKTGHLSLWMNSLLRSRSTERPWRSIKVVSRDDQILFILAVFFVLVSLSPVSRLATITFLLRVLVTGCRLAPNLKPTCPISLATPLHLPCACCALLSPPKPISSPCTLSFFVPFRHWNWCFDGSGRAFRAVFASAGPSPCPLHS